MIQYHMLEFQEFEIFDYNEDRKTITVTERTHESALDFMLIKSLLR